MEVIKILIYIAPIIFALGLSFYLADKTVEQQALWDAQANGLRIEGFSEEEIIERLGKRP